MARFVKLSRDEWTRPGERNDCTVRALAVAGNLSYEEAHRIMARAGRKPKKGAHVEHAFPYRRYPPPRGYRRVKRRGVELVKVDWPFKTTLATFLDKNRKGRFIVRKARHVAAVVDGALHDLYEWRESVKLVTVFHFKVPRRRKAA